jgi:arylsulfatase A-like enzyme
MHRDLNYGPLSNVPVWPPDPQKRWPGASGWYHQSGGPFRYRGEQDRDRMPDEVCSAWAADLVARRHEKPFFVGAGLIRPHSPLYAPDEYFARFPLERINLPPYLENDLADCAGALRNRWAWGFQKFRALIKTGGHKAWKEWVQAYLACMAFADDQVGRMLDALDNGPNRDNTIVVLTGDNGYHVGEKDCIQKWHLWEESTRVPLFIGAPGCAAGAQCGRPVSHIDVYPTLIELCGLPPNPHAPMGGAALDGHSLAALLRDPKRGKWTGPPVALTSISDTDRGGEGPHYSVRSSRYRYTLCANGEEEFYDHKTDPNEWTNRASDPAVRAIKAGLRAELEKLVKSGE